MGLDGDLSGEYRASHPTETFAYRLLKAVGSASILTLKALGITLLMAVLIGIVFWWVFVGIALNNPWYCFGAIWSFFVFSIMERLRYY
jgi:hypothetical protein